MTPTTFWTPSQARARHGSLVSVGRVVSESSEGRSSTRHVLHYLRESPQPTGHLGRHSNT